jgi:hypothetical protein
MEEKDINFKYNECIKSYDKWGETVYQNICTGQKTTMPWGVSGYGIAIFLFTILAILIASLVLIIKFIKDEF